MSRVRKYSDWKPIVVQGAKSIGSYGSHSSGGRGLATAGNVPTWGQDDLSPRAQRFSVVSAPSRKLSMFDNHDVRTPVFEPDHYDERLPSGQLPIRLLTNILVALSVVLFAALITVLVV